MSYGQETMVLDSNTENWLHTYHQQMKQLPSRLKHHEDGDLQVLSTKSLMPVRIEIFPHWNSQNTHSDLKKYIYATSTTHLMLLCVPSDSSGKES